MRVILHDFFKLANPEFTGIVLAVTTNQKIGAKPGAQGSAVFAGHVNNALLKSGVFERLSQIKNGDYITVEDSAGKALVYKVSSVEEYQPDAPTDALFATTGPSRLVLITCDGEWVPSARSYDKRLVVIAEPAY